MAATKIGDKIKFCDEKQRYTLQAFDGRFFILTKPFNAKKTYLYTIVDLERKIRGPCNLIFGPTEELDTLDGAYENLRMLQDGEQEVSHRKHVILTDVEVQIFTPQMSE